MSEDDYRALWDQFAEVHSAAQKEYDSSIRTLASAGLGVTASIGTALHLFSGRAIAAVIAYLVSVACNVASHVTAQWDMNCRHAALLKTQRYESALSSKWTRRTTFLNLAAGVAFIIGGVFLALFVAAAT